VLTHPQEQRRASTTWAVTIIFGAGMSKTWRVSVEITSASASEAPQPWHAVGG